MRTEDCTIKSNLSYLSMLKHECFPDLVINAVEQSRHNRKERGFERFDVVHEQRNVPLVKAHFGSVAKHGDLSQKWTLGILESARTHGVKEEELLDLNHPLEHVGKRKVGDGHVVLCDDD